MAGLVPAIHAAQSQRRVRGRLREQRRLTGTKFSTLAAFLWPFNARNTWMAGTSPAMTPSGVRSPRKRAHLTLPARSSGAVRSSRPGLAIVKLGGSHATGPYLKDWLLGVAGAA